jgi:hypothetical protein
VASEPIRDPKKDHLLTPQNAALIVIDYQPVQVNSIASMDRQLLVNNIVGVAKAAVAYGLPIIQRGEYQACLGPERSHNELLAACGIDGLAKLHVLPSVDRGPVDGGERAEHLLQL